jgi:hypothetical protein
MEKRNTKISVNLTIATNELVFFSSIFLVRCLVKAGEEANPDSSRTILHKFVIILADVVVKI